MGFLDGLGSLFVNRIGIGTKKTLQCEKCKKDTDHIQVSYAEIAEGGDRKWDKKDNEEKALDIGSRVFDHLPLLPTVINGNCFKCSVCGTHKLSGGILSNFHNNEGGFD